MTKQKQNVRLWQKIDPACQDGEIIKETIDVDTLVRIASNCHNRGECGRLLSL